MGSPNVLVIMADDERYSPPQEADYPGSAAAAAIGAHPLPSAIVDLVN